MKKRLKSVEVAFLRCRSIVTSWAVLGVAAGRLWAGALEDPTELMKRAKFREAQTAYEAAAERRPSDLRLRYNAGVAAFRAGDAAAAQRHFEAALASPDLRLQQQAWYNLGSSRFKQAEAAGPDEKVETMKKAGEAFQAATELAPTDRAAKENYAAIQQLVAQLEKQPPTPPDGQDSKSDPKKSKDKKDQAKKDAKNDPQNSKGDPNKAENDEAGDGSEQSQGGQASDKAQSRETGKKQKPSKDASKPENETGESAKNSKGDAEKNKHDGDLAHQPTNRPPTFAQTNRTEPAGKKSDAKDNQNGTDQSGIQRAQPGEPGGENGVAAAESAAGMEGGKEGEGQRMTLVQAQQMLDAQKGSEKPLWTLIRGWGQDQKQPVETPSRRKTW